MPTLLSTINITDGTLYAPTYNTGDVIEVFWDETEKYPEDTPYVLLNGAPITSGLGLIRNLPSNTPAGFQRDLVVNNVSNTYNVLNLISNDTDYYAVSTSDFFPYVTFVSVPAPPPPGSVQDVEVSVASSTKPSNTQTGDGEVVLSGSGTNVPFTYGILNSDGTVTSPQASTIFSGLFAGVYTFIITDSLGYTSTVTFELQAESESYILRWYGEFYNDFGDNNSLTRVEVLQRDYVGVSSEIEISAKEAANVDFRAENKKFRDVTIIPSTATLGIVSRVQDEFQDLLFADETQFLLRKYYLGNLVWEGFFVPGSYKDQLYTTPYMVSLVFSDRLRVLKNTPFLSVTEQRFPGDGEIRGVKSLFEMMTICLNKVGLNFGYRIGANFFAKDHNVSQTTPFHETFVDSAMYLNDDNQTTPCYDVLEDILNAFQAMLFSSDGYWYIIRKQEYLNYFNTDFSLPPAEQIPPPSGLSSIVTGENQIEAFLMWTSPVDVSNSVGIVIEISYDNSNWSELDTVTRTTESYTTPALSGFGPYYFRVYSKADSGFIDSDFSNVSTAEFEAETTTWITNMVSPSDFQVLSLNRYISREKILQVGQTESNQALKDVECNLQLGVQNSLVRSDGLIMDAYGGIVSDSKGFLFNGIDGYVDTLFDLSNAGNKYQQNDAIFGGFVYEDTSDFIQAYYGVRTTPISQLYRNNATTVVALINRSTGGAGTDVDITSSDISKSLFISYKDTPGILNAYLDGTTSSVGSNSTGVPGTDSVFIGARNNNGSLDFASNKKISTAVFGAKIGFDIPYHDENVTILVAELASGQMFNDYASARAWLDAN